MNAADIERLRLHTDQPVLVRSAAGEMRYQRVRPFAVRAGNALMYCPEANVLVSRDVDPESKTPAFKNTLVTIEAELPLPVPSLAAAAR
jgi:anaerobic selenocysteine-containing dehydrogenase